MDAPTCAIMTSFQISSEAAVGATPFVSLTGWCIGAWDGAVMGVVDGNSVCPMKEDLGRVLDVDGCRRP